MSEEINDRVESMLLGEEDIRTPPEIAVANAETVAPVQFAERRMRQIAAEAIREILYPDTNGLATHQHRRVRQWDENGDEWRGVLYKMERPEHAELHKRIEDALHKVEDQ